MEPSAKVVVVICKGGEISMVQARVAAEPAVSTARMLNAARPASVGVPPIAPVPAVSDNPAGNAPDWMDHVSGGKPPEADDDDE
jgi:hypothetical protein